MSQPRLLTIGQVADLCGVSIITIRRWWGADAFPKPKRLANGRSIRWVPADVEKWIAEQPRVTAKVDHDHRRIATASR